VGFAEMGAGEKKIP